MTWDSDNEKVLSNDEKTLFGEYRKSPTVEKRNEIVNKYLHLAEILAKKFVNRGVDYEDIYQVACLALIKAVERFDPEVGVKFASFATPTIVGEIKRFFRDKGSIIRIPRRIYELHKKVNEAKEQLAVTLQRPPRADEIAEHLKISEENVLEILESWNVYNMHSFDQNVFEDDKQDYYETFGVEDNAFERIENNDFIKKSLERFNDSEKEFIKMRYFGNKTQKYIAERMGVSQMYVSRLERKVLDRFRKILQQ